MIISLPTQSHLIADRSHLPAALHQRVGLPLAFTTELPPLDRWLHLVGFESHSGSHTATLLSHLIVHPPEPVRSDNELQNSEKE